MRILNQKQAAEIIGKDPRWLARHRDSLPFAIPPCDDDAQWLYSEAKLLEWMGCVSTVSGKHGIAVYSGGVASS